MRRAKLSNVKLPCCCVEAATKLGLASFLLLVPVLFSPRPAAGQPSDQADTAVVFYAEPKVEATVWPSLLDVFHSEIVRAEDEYALPEDAEAIRGGDLMLGQEFRKIIQVHLIGRCDVVEQAEQSVPRGPLGWVLEVSGEVQPFVYIDCARVAQFLNSATLGMSDDQRRAAMARAISRIAIHEWIHIDSQSARHESRGIRQAELSRRELIYGPGWPHGR